MILDLLVDFLGRVTILCLFPREKFTKPFSEIDELLIKYFTDQFLNGSFPLTLQSLLSPSRALHTQAVLVMAAMQLMPPLPI
jgi:hypothetical protein